MPRVMIVIRNARKLFSQYVAAPPSNTKFFDFVITNILLLTQYVDKIVKF